VFQLDLFQKKIIGTLALTIPRVTLRI